MLQAVNIYKQNNWLSCDEITYKNNSLAANSGLRFQNEILDHLFRD